MEILRHIVFLSFWLLRPLLSFLSFCSIVFNNEFSARLSVRSVLQLRADAITALSTDSKTDKATISRLAHRFLHVSKNQRYKTGVMHPASDDSAGMIKSKNLNESQNDSKGKFL